MAVAVAAVIAGFRYLKQQLAPPGLIVRLLLHRSRLPDGLMESAMKLAISAKAALDVSADRFDGAAREGLREAVYDPPIQQLLIYTMDPHRIDTIEVTVENKSERGIAGLVLVLERILFAFWSAEVRGPLLTTKQMSEFDKSVERIADGGLMMKLPPIASKKSLTVLVHGSLVTGDAHVTVPDGVRYRIENSFR